MARCPHCNEPVSARQETCYACGHEVRARGYKAPHHVNPLVFVAAGLLAVGVLGTLWYSRANADKKEAALLAEEEALLVQDSVRRAKHEWLDAVRAAKDDEEVGALAVQFDDLESRFNSVRLRVAATPTPQQESVIRQVESGFALLHQSAIILGSSPEPERQELRDSIQAGILRVEELTRTLGDGG